MYRVGVSRLIGGRRGGLRPPLCPPTLEPPKKKPNIFTFSNLFFFVQHKKNYSLIRNVNIAKPKMPRCKGIIVFTFTHLK